MSPILNILMANQTKRASQSEPQNDPTPFPKNRFEVMALLMHAHHLDRTYGAGPHTISIPRYALWLG